MAFSLSDSQIFAKAYGDPEVARLFSDSAQIRAMLVFEGALAKAQAAHGVIPADAAETIQRAALDVVIDPGQLADGTATAGVCVPALVKAFRAAIQDENHAQYVHWGATSQDVVDTGLILRMRRILEIYEQRLRAVIVMLGDLAKAHRRTPLIARTRSQPATYTSFGMRFANWGAPLLAHLERLEQLRPRLLRVSLGGASGNLSVMGESGPAVADDLAKALDLYPALVPWHSTRDGIVECAAFLSLLSGSLGKIGQDVILMMREPDTGLSAAAGGGSSTMPQKQNPVTAEQLVHLANLNAGQSGIISQAMIHNEERDGAAWATEWAVLPQMVAHSGLSLLRATELLKSLKANEAPSSSSSDFVFAEACVFALGKRMPRPEAQALIGESVKKALQANITLKEVVSHDFGDIVDWSLVFDPKRQLDAAEIFIERFNAKAHALADAAS